MRFVYYNLAQSLMCVGAFLLCVVAQGSISATWFWWTASGLQLMVALFLFWNIDHDQKPIKWLITLFSVVPLALLWVFPGVPGPEVGMACGSVIATLLIALSNEGRKFDPLRIAGRIIVLFPASAVFALLMWQHYDMLPALAIMASVLALQGLVAYVAPLVILRRPIFV